MAHPISAVRKILGLLIIAAPLVLAGAGVLWFLSQVSIWRTPLVSTETIEAAVKNGDIDQAIRYCQRRIVANPREVGSYCLLGNLYEEKRKFEEAERTYNEIIERAPEYALLRFYLGRTYYSQNRAEDAIGELRYSVTLSEKETDPARQKETLIPALGLLATIYMETTKEYKKAVGVLEKLVEADPKNWEAHYQLGTAYAYAGLSAGAYKEFNKIIKENPGTDIAKYAENAIQYVREKRNPSKSKYVLIH